MPQPYPNGELVVVIDCSDLDRSAQFWAAVLGYEAGRLTSGPYRGLTPVSGVGISVLLQRVPDVKRQKNRLHLDLLSGQAGGPPAMLGPLIGEMLGVEKAPITFSEDGRGHHVRIGDAIDVGVEDFVAIEGHDPVQLTNVFHPSNTTLTVAPANAAHLSTFGIDWGRDGQSGFSAPFSWSA